MHELNTYIVIHVLFTYHEFQIAKFERKAKGIPQPLSKMKDFEIISYYDCLTFLQNHRQANSTTDVRLTYFWT
jgi:hypothetical protein